MHFLIEGHLRQVLKMWIRRSNIKNLEKIDSIWMKQDTPYFIHRRPRSLLENVNRLKAIEIYTVFFLYFEIFKGLIKDEYYSMTLDLILDLRNFMKEIPKVEVLQMKQKFKAYVLKCEFYYGKSFITSVTHSIIHIPSNVLRHGIIAFISTFPYEGYNSIFTKGKLLTKLEFNNLKYFFSLYIL
jgi:hypothetical protein